MLINFDTCNKKAEDIFFDLYLIYSLSFALRTVFAVLAVTLAAVVLEVADLVLGFLPVADFFAALAEVFLIVIFFSSACS